MDDYKIKSLIECGREMREAQKEYFDTRNKSVLKKAKKLEVEFDKRLSEYYGDKKTPDSMPTLFT